MNKDRFQLEREWRAADGTQLVWESLLKDPVTIEVDGDSWTFTPLTSSAALITEGRQMRHAVELYDRQCAHNDSRIFHAAPTGGEDDQHPAARAKSPIATVEIGIMTNLDPDKQREEAPEPKYELVQARGPFNQIPLPSLLKAAHVLGEMYNDVWLAAGRPTQKYQEVPAQAGDLEEQEARMAENRKMTDSL